ncbi:phage tail tape measure protein [Chitinivorax sp. B]|uniref:phage tail tape measure protein n=1 Tax=Chitinivorax sp. B TaxID=2502235 RepID=UPI0010F84EDC|nr:phage tail tape measure protein [Chitinivorax sp. B]
MSSKNLRLEVVLAALDKATKPIKAVLQSSTGLSKQLKATRDQLKALNDTQGHITTFRQLSQDAKHTADKLSDARHKLRQYQQQLAATASPTEAMQRKLQSAQIAVEKLTLAHDKQLTGAKAARAALEQQGISLGRLNQHERELASRIHDTTQAMHKQQAAVGRLADQQRKLQAARSQYEHRLENRERLAGVGAATVGMGATAGLPVIKAIRDYSRYEDAMLGVARQVEGARDDHGRLTVTYYQLGDAIKAMAERIPMATTELAALVEGGARMGVKGRAELLAFAETGALAATAFNLPAGQLGEDLGKIANAYKIPIKHINQLGDTLNYLDDNAQSKGADIINVMQRIAGSTGSMNFKEAAALGSTFLSLGASPEIAATASKAMVRELAIAEKQPKRFQNGLKALGLTAKQVQTAMAKDTTKTILNVLEAVKKLPARDGMGVMVDLFGKEYGDDALKLADNLDEYRKQLKLVNDAKASGSMQREGDAKNDTLSARWQMLHNKLFNQSSAIGQTLRQPLLDIMATAGRVTDRVAAWTKANPQLAATLTKIAAVLALVLAVVGSLLLAVAAVLAPLAAVSFALKTLSLSASTSGGALALLHGGLAMIGNTLLWLGRVLLLNPIGLAITAIAGLAYVLWRNWDWLGPKFAALWQGIKSVVGSVVDWISDVLMNWTVVGFVVQHWQDLHAITLAIWERIKAGIAAVAQGMVNLFLNWSLPGLIIRHWDSITTFLGGLVNRFATLGGQIMDGLVTGFMAGLYKLKGAINGVGESAISWMKEKLGIHSPSRVFAELGSFTMAGFTQGLSDSQGGPLQALRSMTSKLTSLGAGLAIGTAGNLAGAVTLDHRPPMQAQRSVSASAPAPVINISIQASPGMNEQHLAQLVARQVEQVLRQQAIRSRSRFTDQD